MTAPKTWPIAFSPAMVAAGRAGRKSQTRRLAASPLAKVRPGDRLYVREPFFLDARFNGFAPSQAARLGATPAGFIADAAPPADARRRFAREMPRAFHRQHLIVDAVRTERLHAITDDDAVAEGIALGSWEVEEGDDCELVDGWSADRPTAFAHGVGDDAREGFAILWTALHAGRSSLRRAGNLRSSWEDDPEVVVLTFRWINRALRGEQA